MGLGSGAAALGVAATSAAVGAACLWTHCARPARDDLRREAQHLDTPSSTWMSARQLLVAEGCDEEAIAGTYTALVGAGIPDAVWQAELQLMKDEGELEHFIKSIYVHNKKAQLAVPVDTESAGQPDSSPLIPRPQETQEMNIQRERPSPHAARSGTAFQASPRSAVRLSYVAPPPWLRQQIQRHLRYVTEQAASPRPQPVDTAEAKMRASIIQTMSDVVESQPNNDTVEQGLDQDLAQAACKLEPENLEGQMDSFDQVEGSQQIPQKTPQQLEAPTSADENIPLEAEHGKIQRIVKQNLLALQDQHAVGNRFVCYQ